MTPTRIESFIIDAAGNMDTVDALEAISRQLEVAQITFFAVGRTHGISKETDYEAAVTFLGDLHDTLDSLKNHMRRVEVTQPAQVGA